MRRARSEFVPLDKTKQFPIYIANTLLQLQLRNRIFWILPTSKKGANMQQMIVCQKCGQLTLKVRLGAHFQKFCKPCRMDRDAEVARIGSNKYRRNHPERREIINKRNREISPEKREKKNSRTRARVRDLKREVFSAYGGKCACCGESIFEFLSIDHINGDGEAHRNEIGLGLQFWGWIKKNNFPSTLRVLCFNCNCAIGFFCSCPHQDKL